MTAIFIMVLSRITPTENNPFTEKEAPIDQSMHGVNLLRFNKTGHLAQAITMQSWFHHKGQTVTQMIMPTMKVYHPDGSIWNISAKQGIGFQTPINGKVEKLQLSQNVVVQRQDANNSWLKLTTQTLLLFPLKQSALTNDPVHVDGPGVEINALGMRAQLDRQNIEFLKDVNSRYAKPQA